MYLNTPSVKCLGLGRGCDYRRHGKSMEIVHQKSQAARKLPSRDQPGIGPGATPTVDLV